MNKIGRLLIAGALALSTGIPASAHTELRDRARLIDMAHGPIDGVSLATGVDAYLGIPYAAPPVRELRWRRPAPPENWAELHHADGFGSQCVQPLRGVMTNQYSGVEVMSEDCLYLNVWTKPDRIDAPVIVYIHGGAFFVGAVAFARSGAPEFAGLDWRSFDKSNPRLVSLQSNNVGTGSWPSLERFGSFRTVNAEK